MSNSSQLIKISEFIFYISLILYVFLLATSNFLGVDLPFYIANLFILAAIAKSGLKNVTFKQHYTFFTGLLLIHMLSLNDMGYGNFIKCDRETTRFLIIFIGLTDFIIESIKKKILSAILIFFWCWISWLWLPTAGVIMLQILMPTIVLSAFATTLTIKQYKKNN